MSARVINMSAIKKTEINHKKTEKTKLQSEITELDQRIQQLNSEYKDLKAISHTRSKLNTQNQIYKGKISAINQMLNSRIGKIVKISLIAIAAINVAILAPALLISLNFVLLTIPILIFIIMALIKSIHSINNKPLILDEETKEILEEELKDEKSSITDRSITDRSITDRSITDRSITYEKAQSLKFQLKSKQSKLQKEIDKLSDEKFIEETKAKIRENRYKKILRDTELSSLKAQL